MKNLFAFGIFSATIYLAFCQDCDLPTVKQCEQTYKTEINLQSTTNDDKCYYTQKMASCISDAFCMADQRVATTIKSLQKFSKEVCGYSEISLNPQSSKGEHQTTRSVFSMWIGVMIALVILNI